MNSAHFHLMLNHFPVIGLFVGFLLLVLSMIRKSEALKEASLWAFVISALISIPAYLSGEPAEKMVKGLADVSKPIMEQHEEMGGLALAAIIILGILAAVGLIVYRRVETIPMRFIVLPLVLSIIAGGLIGKTANLGGQIRHAEIRKDFQISKSDAKIHERDNKEEDRDEDKEED